MKLESTHDNEFVNARTNNGNHSRFSFSFHRRLSTKKCYASTSMEGATSFFKFKVTKTSFSKFLLNILTDRNLFKLNKVSYKQTLAVTLES